MRGLLQKWERQDQQFLETMRHRVPTLSQILQHLIGQLDDVSAVSRESQRVQDELRALRKAAGEVEARPVMDFFEGMETFMRILAERRVPIEAERIHAVCARVQVLSTLAERWVEAGRDERAAIENILTSAG
ncbi:MAG: hypothetical protein ACREI3_04105 [Nitrospirales bacterium]